MSRLADLLEAHADQLIQRWTHEVRKGLAPDADSESELRDHVPAFLRELESALREGEVSPESRIAREHGRQRERLGFDLAALVNEYRLLRRLILDLIEEANRPASASELRVLAEFIDSAIAEGVAEYTRQQTQERRLLTEAHARDAGERHAWLSTVLASIGDAVLATDTKGRVTFLNSAAEKLTGWTARDAEGLPLSRLCRILDGSTRAPMDHVAERIVRAGVVEHLTEHALLVRTDGVELPIRGSAAPIVDAELGRLGVAFVFRDSSDSKRLEAERETLFREATSARAVAEAERAKLTTLFTQAPVGIAIHDGPEHTFTFANASYRALVGNRELLDKPLLEALPELAGQGFDKIFDRVRTTGESYVNDAVPARVDRMGNGVQEDRFYKVIVTAKRDAQGDVDGILQCAVDVTDEVRKHEQLEELARQVRTREADLRLVTDSIPLLVSFVDKEERYRTVNRAYEDWFGLPQATIVGKTLKEVIGEAAYDVLSPYVRRGLSGERFTFEQRAVPYGRGGTRDIRVSFVPHNDDRGSVTGYVALIEDVTERRRLEQEREALLTSEKAAHLDAEAERQKLFTIFMQAPVAICILEGPLHVYTFANPRYLALVNGRDVVGKPLREALPDLRDGGFDKMMDRVLATGEPFVGKEIEIKLDHHRGDERLIVDFIYQPKRNTKGEIDGILAVITDVTEQVQARRRVEIFAEKLRASEEQLRQVMEASKAGIWEMNPSTREATADARFRDLFGLTPDEPFDLEKGLAIAHPEDSARVAKAFADALAGKNSGEYQAEYRVRRSPSDPVRWISVRGRAEFDRNGEIARIRGMGLDVTTEKEAEASQARLLSALANQPLLYMALVRGPDLRFEVANANYRTVVGGRDVVGRTLYEALPELRGQGFDELLRGVLETGKPFIGREVHTRLDRDGRGVTDAYFDFVYQAVPGPDGRNESVLVLGHDITDDVLARRAADRQQKERADFEQQLIGIVSHDLRNPLNAILMGASLIPRGGLDDRSASTLSRIKSSAERMNRMIRDLLDFTQARLAGGIPISREYMDLHPFLRSVLAEVQTNFPEREIRYDAAGNGEGVWDADRLAQVVTNLVSNALKYSPKGSPVVVRTRGDDESIVLEVHNEGPPIPNDALAYLFEPMRRATTQPENAGRSVGLGLYIVKHLVDAHGGTVNVASSIANGTLFTVTLPRELSASSR